MNETVDNAPTPFEVEQETPKLVGAHWFKTIALLSLLNVVLNLVDVSFIFGLGITQIAEVGALENILNPFVGWLSVLGLPALFFFTWWMAEKKGSKLAYVVGLGIYLFDAYTLYWLYDISGDESLIIDLVIHGALSVYFIYCLVISPSIPAQNESTSTNVNSNTLLYLVVAVVVSLMSFFSFSEFKSFVENPFGFLGYNDDYSEYYDETYDFEDDYEEDDDYYGNYFN